MADHGEQSLRNAAVRVQVPAKAKNEKIEMSELRPNSDIGVKFETCPKSDTNRIRKSFFFVYEFGSESYQNSYVNPT